MPNKSPAPTANAAAMREALEAVAELFIEIQGLGRSPISNKAYAVKRKVYAALSAPPRACDIMPEEDLIKVVSTGIMQSRPEFNCDGLKALVEIVAAAAIKCAYDTQLISKGATDGK